MFDANMRHISKGKRFFAEVHSTDQYGDLYSIGLRRGDVVFCHMLNKTNKNPMVDILINGRKVTVSCRGSGVLNWFVYAGNANGKTGFICDKVKSKANVFLSDLTVNVSNQA